MIHVDTEVKENLIKISIADSGPGIPEEERDDVFKPIHKVDKSRDPITITDWFAHTQSFRC